MSRHLTLTLVAGALAVIGSAAAGSRTPAYGFQSTTTCGIGRVVCQTRTTSEQVCTFSLPSLQLGWTCLRWKTVIRTITYYYPPQPAPVDTNRSGGTSGGGGGTGGPSGNNGDGSCTSSSSGKCEHPGHIL